MKKTFFIFISCVFCLLFANAQLTPNITGVVTNTVCFGSDSGAINVTVTGGTQPYTYSWSSGDTIEDLTNLTAGDYTLTVTAFNNQIDTQSFTVSENSEIAIVVSVQHITCFGDSTGSISLTVSGGVPPYTYFWNDSTTTSNRTNLKAGFHFITVTDTLQCASTNYGIVNQPNKITIQGNITTPTFDACNDGAITISTTYGVPPLSYLWSTADTSKNLNQISIGNYSVVVTDTTGCSVTKQFIIPSIAYALDIPNSNVEVAIDSVYHSYDCNNDGLVGIAGNPEPRWRIAVGTSFNNLNNFTYSPGDNVTCGYLSVNHTYSPIDSVCANTLIVYALSWEDDACGSDTTYSSSGFFCFGNYDDALAVDTFFVTYVNNAENTWVSQIFTEKNGYKVALRTRWKANYPNPEVLGTHNFCVGDTTNLLLSSLPDSSYHYIWNNCTTDTIKTISSSGIYTVAVTNDACIQRSDSFVVQFHPLPDTAGVYLNMDNATFHCTDTTAPLYEWGYDVITDDTSIIGTSTTYYYTPLNIDTVANLYWVSITNQYGCGRRIYFNGNTISALSDLAETGKVLVYPNPAKENCIVKFDNPFEGGINFMLTDLSGRAVYSQSFLSEGSTSFSLDISKVAQGIYVLHAARNSVTVFREKLEVIR